MTMMQSPSVLPSRVSSLNGRSNRPLSSRCSNLSCSKCSNPSNDPSSNSKVSIGKPSNFPIAPMLKISANTASDREDEAVPFSVTRPQQQQFQQQQQQQAFQQRQQQNFVSFCTIFSLKNYVAAAAATAATVPAAAATMSGHFALVWSVVASEPRCVQGQLFNYYNVFVAFNFFSSPIVKRMCETK